MDRGAWWAAVHGAAGSDMTEHTHHSRYSPAGAAVVLSCLSQWPRQGPTSGRCSKAEGRDHGLRPSEGTVPSPLQEGTSVYATGS